MCYNKNQSILECYCPFTMPMGLHWIQRLVLNSSVVSFTSILLTNNPDIQATSSFQLNMLTCSCTHTEKSLTFVKSGVSNSFTQRSLTHDPQCGKLCTPTGNQRCLRPSPSHKDLRISEVLLLTNTQFK